MLTLENYAQGFLIDEEWMAGVSEEAREHPGAEPSYSAFIVNHGTGECVVYRRFATLEAALDHVNAIPRQWRFEATSECGGCGGESGEGCGKGACKQSCQTTGVCELSS